MHFYRDKELNVFCSVCADREKLPLGAHEGTSKDDLHYLGISTEAFDFANPVTCHDCGERFIVHDGRVYREVQ